MMEESNNTIFTTIAEERNKIDWEKDPRIEKDEDGRKFIKFKILDDKGNEVIVPVSELFHSLKKDGDKQKGYETKIVENIDYSYDENPCLFESKSPGKIEKVRGKQVKGKYLTPFEYYCPTFHKIFYKLPVINVFYEFWFERYRDNCIVRDLYAAHNVSFDREDYKKKSNFIKSLYYK